MKRIYGYILLSLLFSAILLSACSAASPPLPDVVQAGELVDNKPGTRHRFLYSHTDEFFSQVIGGTAGRAAFNLNRRRGR